MLTDALFLDRNRIALCVSDTIVDSEGTTFRDSETPTSLVNEEDPLEACPFVGAIHSFDIRWLALHSQCFGLTHVVLQQDPTPFAHAIFTIRDFLGVRPPRSC